MAQPITYRDFWYDEDRKIVFTAATIDAFDDEPDAQVSVISVLLPDGTFAFRGLDGMRARSVASTGRYIWVVGKYGEAWTYPGTKKVAVEDQLPDAGVRSDRHLGPPNRIRVIAGLPYVCGFAGQVYTLADGRWVHMDDGIVEPEGRAGSLDLEGIHGTAQDDLYVVGSKGTLARWDGRVWTRVPLLTTAFLAGVRALARDHVVAVGNDGVFVEWDGQNWNVTQIPGEEKTLLSDVEMFNGDLYVAAVGRLFVRRANTFRWDEVTTRLKEKPGFIRLTVGDGRLWAMGSKRIHSFDGKHWVAHVDPDNG